jgi:nucleoside-diphosphate-sugar epimerase
MKILITGNMGYIGPVVIKHLRQRFPGVHLVGCDMGYFATCLTGTKFFPECLMDFQYFGDVRSIDSKMLNEMDAIVHLAAISNDPMGKAFEKETYGINHQASVRLAKMAKKQGVKSFVFASSCSMYGFGGQDAKTEDSEFSPLTAYAKSKVMTERDLKGIAGEGFKVTSLRFSTACGMSDRLRLDLVLNDFVAGAVASKKIQILSDGTPWRPLINIKDMARAIEWALTREVDGTDDFLAVNVGSNEWNYQVKELAEAVADTVPGTEISINKNAEPDKRSYRVSFDLFRKLAPEHQPQYDLKTSIRELHDGLTQMKFDDKEFRNSNYMRLKVLKYLREQEAIDGNLQWSNKNVMAGHSNGSRG